MTDAHTASLSKAYRLDVMPIRLAHGPDSLQNYSIGRWETFGPFPSHTINQVRSGSDRDLSETSLRMANSKEVTLANGIPPSRRTLKLSRQRSFCIGSPIQTTSSSELQSTRSKRRRPPSPSILHGTPNKRQRRRDSVARVRREARESGIVVDMMDGSYEHPPHQNQRGYLQNRLGSSRSHNDRSSLRRLGAGSPSRGHEYSPKNRDSSKENPAEPFEVGRANFERLQSTRAVRNIRATSIFPSFGDFGKIGTKSIDLRDDLDKFDSKNNSSVLHRSPTRQRSKRAASLAPGGLGTSKIILSTPPVWATEPNKAKKTPFSSLVDGSQPRDTPKDGGTFEIHDSDDNDDDNEVYYTLESRGPAREITSNHFVRTQSVTVTPRQYTTPRENLNRDSIFSKHTSKQLIVDQQQSINQWIEDISPPLENLLGQTGRSKDIGPSYQRGRQTSVPLLIPQSQQKPGEEFKVLSQVHVETDHEYKDRIAHTPNRASSESSDSASFETLMRISRKALKGKKQLSPNRDYHIKDILPKTNIFEGQERKKQNSIPSLVIDHIRDSAEESLVRVPMKDRIAPPKRPAEKKAPRAKSQARSKTLASKENPKEKSRSQKKALPTRELDQAREKRAAELIHSKEAESQINEVFGEKLEDKVLKAEMAEELRAERERERKTRAAAALEKEEVDRLIAEELQRKYEEEAERSRVKKAIDEAIAKKRREAERKKTEAAEHIITEEYRRKAEEKIQTDRDKQAAGIEEQEREREKQRATTIQAELEEIERKKAKQEELKKQVASLQISKFSGALSAVPSSSLASTVHEDASGECSLFLPDVLAIHSKRTSKPINQTGRYEATSDRAFPSGLDPSQKDCYDIDDRITCAKSMGPTTAAELCAIVQVKQNSSNYRTEREAFEAQVTSENARKALAQRGDKTKNSQAKEAAQKVAEKEALKAKLKPEPTLEKNDPITTAIFAPQLDFNYSHPWCEPAPKPVEITTLIKPSQVVPLMPSSLEASAEKRTLRVLSEAETRIYEQQRYKEKNQEAERIREEKARLQTQKHEENKKKARERCEKIALEKKKQELLDRAAASGTQMAEIDLALQLEDFKQKRAKRNKKLNESRLKNQERQNREPIYENFGSSVLYDSEVEEGNIQKAKIKERRQAIASASFSHASSMTVANEPDSDESEEDPLEEIFGEKTIPISDDDLNQIGDEEEIDIEMEGDAEEAEPDIRLSNDKTERAQLLDRPIELVHNKSSAILDYNAYVYVYKVKQCVTKKNIQETPLIKQIFLDLKEATSFAKELAERYRRQEAASGFIEKPYNNLYAADIYMGNDSVMVYMERVLKAKDATELTKFDTSNILNAPRHCYFVISIIKKQYKDDDGEIVNVHAQEVYDNFIDMNLAGADACKKLINFLEPKRGILEYTEKHENKLAPEIRKQRDIAVDERREFDLIVDDELPDWMVQQGYKSINFMVEDRPFHGPMN